MSTRQNEREHVQLWIELSKTPLTIVEHRDRPDFILRGPKGNIALEVTSITNSDIKKARVSRGSDNRLTAAAQASGLEDCYMVVLHPNSSALSDRNRRARFEANVMTVIREHCSSVRNGKTLIISFDGLTGLPGSRVPVQHYLKTEAKPWLEVQLAKDVLPPELARSLHAVAEELVAYPKFKDPTGRGVFIAHHGYSDPEIREATIQSAIQKKDALVDSYRAATNDLPLWLLLVLGDDFSQIPISLPVEDCYSARFDEVHLVHVQSKKVQYIHPKAHT